MPDPRSWTRSLLLTLAPRPVAGSIPALAPGRISGLAAGLATGLTAGLLWAALAPAAALAQNATVGEDPAQGASNTPWDVTRARGETRTIDFTTDEGTWMSVDPAPDGQWVAFDLLGHIYRMPASGWRSRGAHREQRGGRELPSALLARRATHRLHHGPGGAGQPLGHERRRLRTPAPSS
jgi:hypothetical protein